MPYRNLSYISEIPLLTGVGINIDFLSLQLMNRLISFIIAGSIASIATLTIAQTTDARTCTLYRNCYYHTSRTYKSEIENDSHKNLYKSALLSIFIILVTTRIAKTALEAWLTKV
jgi:hypothetical protein